MELVATKSSALPRARIVRTSIGRGETNLLGVRLPLGPDPSVLQSTSPGFEGAQMIVHGLAARVGHANCGHRADREVGTPCVLPGLGCRGPALRGSGEVGDRFQTKIVDRTSVGYNSLSQVAGRVQDLRRQMTEEMAIASHR